jgi:hypothetical protein
MAVIVTRLHVRHVDVCSMTIISPFGLSNVLLKQTWQPTVLHVTSDPADFTNVTEVFVLATRNETAMNIRVVNLNASAVAVDFVWSAQEVEQSNSEAKILSMQADSLTAVNTPATPAFVQITEGPCLEVRAAATTLNDAKTKRQPRTLQFQAPKYSISVITVPLKIDDDDGSPITHTVDPSCSTQPLGACNHALQAALSACPLQDCSIELEPGNYSWHMGVPVSANGLERLRLSAHGATLQLTGPAISGPALLQFEGCQELAVLGLTVDAPRPLYTLGVVESIDNATSSFRMRVDPTQYPLAASTGGAGLLWPWLSRAQAVLGWDATQNRPGGSAKAVDIYQLKAPAGSFRLVEAAVAEVQVISSYLTNGDGFREIKPGQTVLVRHVVYTAVGLLVMNCSDVLIEDVKLFASPGMGFKAQRSRGLTLTRYRVARAAGRPMSTNADGAHFETCGGHIDISHSAFEGQGDDGVNVSHVGAQHHRSCVLCSVHVG